MGGLTNMLLAQAAPGQPSGLSPEALEAIRQLRESGALPLEGQAPEQELEVPAAPPAAPEEGGGILGMLKKWFTNKFLPSTQSLAPAGAQAPPPTPEELERKRREMAGAAAPLAGAVAGQ